MTEVDVSDDVSKFEELFKDRFTEKDAAFMELKSKPLSPPAVIHPWKTAQKQWNKRWDYNSRRRDDRRRSPSRDGECSQGRNFESNHESHHNRNYHRDRSYSERSGRSYSEHSDRSYSERSDRSYSDRSDRRNREHRNFRN